FPARLGGERIAGTHLLNQPVVAVPAVAGALLLRAAHGTHHGGQVAAGVVAIAGNDAALVDVFRQQRTAGVVATVDLAAIRVLDAGDLVVAVVVSDGLHAPGI